MLREVGQPFWSLIALGCGWKPGGEAGGHVCLFWPFKKTVLLAGEETAWGQTLATSWTLHSFIKFLLEGQVKL